MKRICDCGSEKWKATFFQGQKTCTVECEGCGRRVHEGHTGQLKSFDPYKGMVKHEEYWMNRRKKIRGIL